VEEGEHQALSAQEHRSKSSGTSREAAMRAPHFRSNRAISSYPEEDGGIFKIRTDLQNPEELLEEVMDHCSHVSVHGSRRICQDLGTDIICSRRAIWISWSLRANVAHHASRG